MLFYLDLTGWGGTIVLWFVAFRWGSHVKALRRWTWYG